MSVPLFFAELPERILQEHPEVCLGPALTVAVSGLEVIKVIFSLDESFGQCPGRLILVPVVVRRVTARNSFHSEALLLVLIDRTLKTIELVNLYPGTIDYPQLNSKLQEFFRDLLPSFSFRTTADWTTYHPDTSYTLLFYLESRVMNPDATHDEILAAMSSNPALVNQYRDRILASTTTPSSPVKRGIIFCHGRTHSDYPISSNLPQDVQWTLVDIDKETQPDRVGSYTSGTTIQDLGQFGWNYVISANCPIAGSIGPTEDFLKAARRLLRPGGQVIVPGLVYNSSFLFDLDGLGVKYGSHAALEQALRTGGAQDVLREIEKLRRLYHFSSSRIDDGTVTFTV